MDSLHSTIIADLKATIEAKQEFINELLIKITSLDKKLQSKQELLEVCINQIGELQSELKLTKEQWNNESLARIRAILLEQGYLV